MFVKRLEIANIRSFVSADLLLSPGINIITGSNNSGKSSILKSIYLLQESYALGQTGKRIYSNLSHVRITLSGIRDAEKRFFQNPNTSEPTTPDKGMAQVYFPRSEPTVEAYFTPHEKQPHITLSEWTMQQLRTAYSFRFAAFPNQENQGNFIYPFFSKRRNAFMVTSGKNESYHVFDDLRNLPLKVLKASNRSVTKHRFQQYCRDILGFEIGLYEGPNGENRIGLPIGYNDYIPIESMGEGTANILGLIVLLLTENHKLFLIEELENDIHPEALKKLLQLIVEKSAGNQFVISSHSHIILKHLGAIPDTKIFFSEMSVNEDGLPTSIVSEISTSAQDRLRVLERLGYDLLDLDLYKGYLILEESTAEKMIRDFLIPAFVPGLLSKIKTIAAQGAEDVSRKFHNVNSLFVYLHKSELYQGRSWVIVDGDEKGRNIVDQLRSRYSSRSGNEFMHLSKCNFEEYYPERFADEVHTALSFKHGKEKQEAKMQLLQKVLAWTSQFPDEARKAFEVSSREIIELLKRINEQLHL